MHLKCYFREYRDLMLLVRWGRMGCRYPGAAAGEDRVVSKQDDPEMALVLLPGMDTFAAAVVKVITATKLHRIPTSLRPVNRNLEDISCICTNGKTTLKMSQFSKTKFVGCVLFSPFSLVAVSTPM